MQNLQQFIQNGGKVKVRHHRTFNFVCRLEDQNGKSLHDNMLTRGEYERAAKDGTLVYDDYGNNGHVSSEFGNPSNVPYSVAVCNNGGFTTVELTANGKTFVGKFNFSKTTQFNRRIGFIAACGRALKKLNNESS